MAGKKRGLTLEAIVLSHGTPRTLSQLEACDFFQVSDRTLRIWAERGMPVRQGPSGRPVYPLPDAGIWVSAYQIRMRDNKNGRALGYLAMEKARDMALAFQFRTWPEDFVVVPLDWDHPARESQLRTAAAGRQPPSENALRDMERRA
ncbi:MAG: hypothetical protein ACREL3_07085 [Gemmatimonadales bacterium]